MATPRPNSIVQFSGDAPSFVVGDIMVHDISTFVFLGEIPNKEGFCVVIDSKGTVYTDFLTYYFEEV